MWDDYLQMLKIFAFLIAAVVVIKFVRRFLFPEDRNKTEELPPLPAGWEQMETITPEDLVPDDLVLRDDALELIYMRKAEPNEYRQGVDEWLFHPPGSKEDFWAGIVREDFDTIKRVQKAADRQENE